MDATTTNVSPAVRAAFDALRAAGEASDRAFARYLTGEVASSSAATRLARVVEERRGEFDHAVYSDAALDAIHAEPNDVYADLERSL